MAITTVPKVNEILQISGKDSLIGELIPLVEEDYQEIRQKKFEKDDDDLTIYPNSSELTAIKMIGYLLSNNYGIKSESLGDYSVTFESDKMGGYPRSIVGRIRRHLRW